MFTALFVLILVGFLLSAVGVVLALGAWLRLRQARRAFSRDVTDEIVSLGSQAGELERRAASLGARSAALPIKIAELQQSITVLQTLAGALAISLDQARRVLTFPAFKTISASRLSKALGPALERLDRRNQRRR